MRILLSQNLVYLPAHGGASKANRLVLRQLAALGHTCAAVAPMTGRNREVTTGEFLRYLAGRGLTAESTSDGTVVVDDGGVTAHVVPGASRLPIEAARLGRAFAPDVVLVSAEDPGCVLLNAAFETAGPSRVVSVVHTLTDLPFGPDADRPSAAGARQLRRAAGVLTVSAVAERYLREHGGLDPRLVRLPVYGTGPFPRHGDPDRGAVTMINPSAVKGIAMFLELARRLPDVPFLAVPTWATTAAERAALAALPNVRTADPVDDIDLLFARTRVLLMPSVWPETFGMAAVEAMLRGIPVLASDIGGLPEAMLGVPHLLPPSAADTWTAVLSRLLTDRTHYREVAGLGRDAAARFVAAARIEDVAEHLAEVHRRAAPPGAAAPADGGADLRRRVGELSPAQRRLLGRMLAGEAGA